MIPLKQKFRHDPANGVYGDCARAAVASIFEMPLDDVPHFYDKDASDIDGKIAFTNFLLERGLRPISVPFPGAIPIEDILGTMRRLNPDVHYLLTGTSRSGVNHVVVCKDDQIIHDPSLDDSGIVGPCSDGCWWLEFIGADI